MELEPVKPSLEYLCRGYVDLASPVIVGKTPLGERRIIPFGGRYVGEKLSGEILPGGADFQLIRPDGTALLDARYAIRTPDGAVVYVHNYGRRSAPEAVRERMTRGETVDPAEYYFRATPEFETATPQYAWLNDVVALCSGVRTADAVVLDIYVVR
jgi:Protein of unknown function (DUF3237)